MSSSCCCFLFWVFFLFAEKHLSETRTVLTKDVTLIFRLPGEESDIEGMEVIAEDGENLADDDEEALQEEEKKETPEERAPEKGRNES